MSKLIEIEVNGEPREVREEFRPDELIADLALAPERVAVELNREVVSRRAWSERVLAAGDKVEIVHFVGGGWRARRRRRR